MSRTIETIQSEITALEAELKTARDEAMREGRAAAAAFQFEYAYSAEWKCDCLVWISRDVTPECQSRIDAHNEAFPATPVKPFVGGMAHVLTYGNRLMEYSGGSVIVSICREGSVFGPHAFDRLSRPLTDDELTLLRSGNVPTEWTRN